MGPKIGQTLCTMKRALRVRRLVEGRLYERRVSVGGHLSMLKPHDLRHGVAMEILEQQHDLEAVRAMLGHARIDTTQTYAQIKPAHLKRAVEFYEGPALDILSR